MSFLKTSESAKRGRSPCSDKGGAAALEFALVAPAFFLLAFGAVEISIMLHKASSVQWAIERAARAASLDAAMTESKMQALVDANLESVGADIAVDIAYSTETGADVVFGRVSATYLYPLKILFLPEHTLSFVTDVTLVRPAPT